MDAADTPEPRPAKDFREVVAWQRAHQFVLQAYRLTEAFPRHELFGLTGQLRRAAMSIPANIAEGFARQTDAEKLRFFNIAQGSAEECRYYLILCRDLGYADPTTEESQLEEASKVLAGYVAAIRRRLGN
ncbi:MAG: four helix bundle protein [Armatimonadetes bacterium]|nr:four helix bundle protein [Armatimonadota bacterium]